MATETEVAQIVALISAAYPNFNPTEQTVEVYYQTLKDLPGDELKAAALTAIAEAGRKFAPSVGELRGAVGEIRKAVHNLPSSYQAWEEVLKQMVRVGSYRSPEFSHPLIHRVVDTLGWKNLCLSENAVADRARFIQAYEQLLMRFERDDLLLPEVRGYIEANGGRLPAPASQMQLLADKWRT